MASEVTSDLKFELSDLNYPISTAFQASTATISRILHNRISSVDLRTCTSWQVKTLPQEYVLSTCSKLDATSTGMFVVLMMQRQDKSKEMSAGDEICNGLPHDQGKKIFPVADPLPNYRSTWLLNQALHLSSRN